MKELPFPAVTLKGVKVNNAKRLLESTLNLFKFDCFTKTDHDLGLCVNDTAIIRQDLRPFITKALQQRFKMAYQTLKGLMQRQDPSVNHPAFDAARVLCKVLRKQSYKYYGNIISLLFWIDEALADNDEDMSPVVDQLLSFVAEIFRYIFTLSFRFWLVETSQIFMNM